MEQTGLEYILQDKEFQAGMGRVLKGMAVLGTATERAAADMTKQMKGADTSVSRSLQGIGQSATMMQTAFGTAIGVITAQLIPQLIGGMKNAMGAMNDWGGQIDRLGDQFGYSAKDASAFSYLANKVGLSVDEMGFGFNTFTRGLAEAGGKENDFTKALKQLGVRAFDSKGKLRDLNSMLPEMLDAFKKLPPGVKATDLAMKLFGARGGTKFLDFLRQGSDGLKDAKEKVKALGLELTDKAADDIEQLGFLWNEVGLGFKAVAVNLGLRLLPYIKDFATFMRDRVIPIVSQFAGTVLSTAVRLLQQFGTALAPIFKALQPFVKQIQDLLQRMWGYFSKGNVEGVINELMTFLGNAFRGFDLAKTLGDIGGALANALSQNWPKIQAQLSTWGTRFWTWLTGEGGALSMVGSQLKKVVDAIVDWVGKASNIDPIVNTMKSWVTQFWWWLTNPQGGLIATVFDTMAKLAKQLEDWSKDPATIERIQAIGEQVARYIFDGMGKLFDNREEGEALWDRLINMLYNTVNSIREAVSSLGASLASGFIGGIAKEFVDADSVARIKNALYDSFKQAFSILIGPGGPMLGLVDFLMAPIFNRVKQWLIDIKNAIVGAFTGTTPSMPIPPSPGPGYYWDPVQQKWVWKGKTYQSGGWVGQTAPALLHAGEFVLNRQQARAMAPVVSGGTTTNYYNTFAHSWQGNISAADRAWIESTVEQATDRSFKDILGRG